MTFTGWERMSGDHFSLMAIPELRVSAAPWPGSWTGGGRGRGSDGHRGVHEKIVLRFIKKQKGRLYSGGPSQQT